jgi:hypothetical protein
MPCGLLQHRKYDANFVSFETSSLHSHLVMPLQTVPSECMMIRITSMPGLEKQKAIQIRYRAACSAIVGRVRPKR